MQWLCHSDNGPRRPSCAERRLKGSGDEEDVDFHANVLIRPRRLNHGHVGVYLRTRASREEQKRVHPRGLEKKKRGNIPDRTFCFGRQAFQALDTGCYFTK